MEHEFKDADGKTYWFVNGKKHYPEARPARVRTSKGANEETLRSLKAVGESPSPVAPERKRTK